MEAKLFRVGGSQAVRLPKAFRFAGDRVRIRREGAAVILEPAPASEADVLDFLNTVTIPDFMPEGREQPAPQDRH